MDTPPFVLKPISHSALLTCPYLVRDLSLAQIAQCRCLSYSTIESHTRIVREAMQCRSLPTALLRMVALGLITREQLIPELPPHWLPYVLQPCPCITSLIIS